MYKGARGVAGCAVGTFSTRRETPSGKLVLTLKRDEQSATKADIAELADQLHQLKALLTARG